MHIVLDCETTGLPRDWKAPAANVDNWPRIVQLAWTTYEVDQKETSSHMEAEGRYGDTG